MNQHISSEESQQLIKNSKKSEIKLNPQIQNYGTDIHHHDLKKQTYEVSDSSLKRIGNNRNTTKDDDECKYVVFDIRQKYKKQNNNFMCLIIFKAVSFGILFAIILFTLLYDKIFFKRHYYSDNPNLIKNQPEYAISKQFQIFSKGNWLIKQTTKKDSIYFKKINDQNPKQFQMNSIYKDFSRPWQKQSDSNNNNIDNSIRQIKLQYNQLNTNQISQIKGSNDFIYIPPLVPPHLQFNNQNYHQINPLNSADKYNFRKSLMLQLKQTKISINEKDQINKYELVNRLIEVTHNVNYQGRIQVEKTEVDTTQEQLKQKQQRIKHALNLEKKYYQQKYEISKYIQNQLPFCIMVPSYNNANSRLYLRNLDSIFMQQYSNYHVVYVDDASPDKTGEQVKKYLNNKNIPSEKINVIINKKNVLALQNLYNNIHNHCKSGQIVMLLDGDDSFIGRQVLSSFNAAYQKNRAGLVYSQYVTITGNERAGFGGSSSQIPQYLLKQQGKFRSARNFYTSHLLTFYSDLFKMIKKQDLTYDNGTFFKFAYDVALVTPIIEMLGERLFFLQQNNYEYRYDTGINDPGWGQIQVDNIVFGKKPYKKLNQYPFIDRFYSDLQSPSQKNKNLSKKQYAQNLQREKKIEQSLQIISKNLEIQFKQASLSQKNEKQK